MGIERVWSPFPDATEGPLSKVVCVVRVPDNQRHRCGYVGIPEESSYYGLEDTDILPEPLMKLGVHGGVTYTGAFLPGDTLGFEGLWWIGFDCGHFDDAPDPTILLEYIPANVLPERYGHVWSHEEVVTECESLARQVCAEFIPVEPMAEDCTSNLGQRSLIF